MAYENEGLIAAEARRARRAQFSIWLLLATPALALLIQVYLPLFQTLQFISRIELPLLVTIYFGLMRRSQIRGLTLGMLMGLTQDCFARDYMLGMNGICKTLVGYFAASIGMQFDVESGIVRLLLCSIFYLFHQFVYWVLQRSLLGQAVGFDILTELFWTVINAFLGVLLFALLDRFRKKE
jgi:rod shape-determining protein MreD